MGLNDINREFSDSINSMADDLTDSLPISRPDLHAAFSDEQIEKLHAMITDVNAATGQNQKVLKLQQHAETALSLLTKLGVAL